MFETPPLLRQPGLSFADGQFCTEHPTFWVDAQIIWVALSALSVLVASNSEILLYQAGTAAARAAAGESPWEANKFSPLSVAPEGAKRQFCA
jgi:hypothetical protein